MEVKVLIRRNYQEDHIPFLKPVLQQLYAIVQEYGGYISGETFVNCEKPQDHLIISQWSSLDKWQAYHRDERVKKLCNEIDLIIGQPTTHLVYQKE